MRPHESREAQRSARVSVNNPRLEPLAYSNLREFRFRAEITLIPRGTPRDAGSGGASADSLVPKAALRIIPYAAEEESDTR